MKAIVNLFTKVVFLIVLALAAVSVSAQDAKLHFERLNALEAKARDVVEVNVDGKLLDLAKRVTTKLNDKDARTVGQAISGLKGIYVRVYNFAEPNQYDMADIDQIRAELNNPSWQKVANVRSKKNDQKVDIFTMFTGDQMSGAAVVISDTKTVALVNVVGVIDIDTLVELSGRLNIPKVDIERDTKTASTKPVN
ncbi:MAG TPA: DUF4252 domain-containing protein [Pyrinomonadaceae bacterium]|nr:DUF4252 domain-containing protein [Pyrinomonadaceae bacterium]